MTQTRRREMEGKGERPIGRRSLKQTLTGGDRLLWQQLKRGHPIWMRNVDRVEYGIDQVEQLFALRSDRQRHVAGRVPWRGNGVDAG